MFRLTQDVYQTAKIAKLLLMMEKGNGADFQGKTLEQIDIHLESLEEEKLPELDTASGKSLSGIFKLV